MDIHEIKYKTADIFKKIIIATLGDIFMLDIIWEIRKVVIQEYGNLNIF